MERKVGIKRNFKYKTVIWLFFCFKVFLNCISFNMERLKNEKFIRNVISNAAIFVLIVIVSAGCFFGSINTNVKLASNSEYNGTIYAGDKSSNNISFMINVYWGNEYLEKMLETLKNYGVKTTFFIGGSWAISNQSLLKKIKEDGHEIASHGYSHKDHGKLDYNLNLIEIQKCHNVVKEVLNVDMELFAPPSGSYNDCTIKAANDLGYKTIMWTRDTIDWRDKDANLIYNRATIGLSGGDLVLMHPTSCTADSLQKIIEFAKRKKLNPTTVSETLGL